MRISRGLTQKELATALELGSQSSVARLEDPSYGRMTLSTLSKVAAFFDVAFIAKMLPYTKFLAETEDVSPAAMIVESFASEDEAGAIENAPEAKLIRHVKNVAHTIPIVIAFDEALSIGTAVPALSLNVAGYFMRGAPGTLHTTFEAEDAA